MVFCSTLAPCGRPHPVAMQRFADFAQARGFVCMRAPAFRSRAIYLACGCPHSAATGAYRIHAAVRIRCACVRDASPLQRQRPCLGPLLILATPGLRTYVHCSHTHWQHRWHTFHDLCVGRVLETTAASPTTRSVLHCFVTCSCFSLGYIGSPCRSEAIWRNCGAK